MKSISGEKFGALLLGTMIAIFMMAVLIFFFLRLYMNNDFSILVALVFVVIVAPLVARAVFSHKKDGNREFR